MNGTGASAPAFFMGAEGLPNWDYITRSKRSFLHGTIF